MDSKIAQTIWNLDWILWISKSKSKMATNLVNFQIWNRDYLQTGPFLTILNLDSRFPLLQIQIFKRSGQKCCLQVFKNMLQDSPFKKCSPMTIWITALWVMEPFKSCITYVLYLNGSCHSNKNYFHCSNADLNIQMPAI